MQTPAIATWHRSGKTCVGGGPCGLFAYRVPPTVVPAAIVVPAVASPPIDPLPEMLEVEEIALPVTLAGLLIEIEPFAHRFPMILLLLVIVTEAVVHVDVPVDVRGVRDRQVPVGDVDVAVVALSCP